MIYNDIIYEIWFNKEWEVYFEKEKLLFVFSQSRKKNGRQRYCQKKMIDNRKDKITGMWIIKEKI